MSALKNDTSAVIPSPRPSPFGGGLGWGFVLFVLVIALAACSSNDGITITPPVSDTEVGSTTEPVEVTEPGEVTAVTSITLVPILTEGLADPTYLTHAGDERLFVVEKPGRIRIIQDGTLLAEPFLDISERVESGFSERGLLSVAFHPKYAENGNLFVDYTNK
ncbi:MAG: PQQ-dependent sugar dehydrogenase, partial [Anaerolineae bacterium]|nr:PQQ-dependent sugar dehydrogenase [Anaerolineae bacterium]